MTSAANIKAGEAWVGIHGKMGNLPEVLDKARRQVGTFAGSVEQFGDKVGQKFGTTIMNGLVGFAAVGAVDNAMRAVADRMRKAAENGESIGFDEVGSAIGESIVEGLRSTLIVGSAFDVGKTIADSLLGSPLAQEKAQQFAQAQSASIAELFRDLQQVQDSASISLVSDKGFSLDKVREYVRVTEAELIRLGSSSTGARRAAQQAIEAYTNLISQLEAGASAENKIATLLETFEEMSGALDENAMAAHRLETSLSEISELMTKSGRSPEDINQTLETIRADFEYSRLLQDSNRRNREIEELVSSIERESKEFGKSQVQLLEYELKRLGATQDQMDRGLEAALDLEDKRREAERRANSLGSISTRQEAYGTFLSGAFNAIGGAGTGELNGNTRETARNTRRMVTLLERNQLVYGA